MINKFSIGFVLAAAAIVGAVDYYDQTNKAGLGFGEITVGGYVQSISDRIGAAKDEKQAQLAERERQSRWRQGGQVFLPEAPEGWTRRALLEGDDTAIMPPEAREMGDSIGKSFLEQQNAQKHLKEQKKRAARSWIYQRGTETVYVEVQLSDRPDKDTFFGLVASALDSAMADNFNRDLGFGVYGGFGLTEKMADSGKRPYHFRYLEGSIGFGQEVHLKVHANASRAATEEILSAIDFDGLNTLLPEPMPYVSNDFVLPAGLDPVQTSLDLRAIKSEFLSLRALEAQNRIANLDTNAMLLNVYSMQLGGKGGFDITGGKVKNLSDIVTLGYRTAVVGLLEGNSYEQVQADVTQMVETAMMVVDAETAEAAARAANAPAPEMSPELQAELARLAAGGVATDGTRHAQVNPLSETDLTETRKNLGKPISKSLGAAQMRAVAGTMEVSQKDAALSFMRESIKFAKMHELPESACEFKLKTARVECDQVSKTFAKSQQAAAQGGSDTAGTSAPGTVVMIVDEAASDRDAGKLVSMAIDPIEFQKFKQSKNSSDAAMRMGMMIAAEGFEKKHGLAKGTCDFAMARLRIECDAARQTSEASSGALGGLLGTLTGQAGASQPAPAEKPKRLQLSGGGQKTSGGKRCVGSFCD